VTVIGRVLTRYPQDDAERRLAPDQGRAVEGWAVYAQTSPEDQDQGGAAQRREDLEHGHASSRPSTPPGRWNDDRKSVEANGALALPCAWAASWVYAISAPSGRTLALPSDLLRELLTHDVARGGSAPTRRKQPGIHQAPQITCCCGGGHTSLGGIGGAVRPVEQALLERDHEPIGPSASLHEPLQIRPALASLDELP